MSESHIVAVRGLRKTFASTEPPVEAIRGIDLEIPRGQFVAVTGPSGSGKSTLLHLIGGLDAPSAGLVQIDGRDLTTLNDEALTTLRRRQIGFVFQAFNLLPILTAAENVALPLQFDGIAESLALARAREALTHVGLADRADHFPAELSGGEQQRVAVARATVTQPIVLLADEPTGNLDSAAGDAITSMLRRFADDHGQTILMVTHDPRHAAMADRIVSLRDGVIVDDQRLARHSSPSELLAELR